MTADDPVKRAYDEGYRVGRERGRREAEVEAAWMHALLVQQAGGRIEIPESARVAVSRSLRLAREDTIEGRIVLTVREPPADLDAS